MTNSSDHARGPGVAENTDAQALTIVGNLLDNESDHAGVGLTLVRDAVQAARGAMSIERYPDGLAFDVTLLPRRR